MDVEISRRRFVSGMGAATVVLFVDGAPAVRAAQRLLPSALGTRSGGTRVIRAQDQLDVQVDVYGGTVSGGVITADSNTRVVLTFGPQHVAERHYAENANVNALGPAAHAAAGPSLVVISLAPSSVIPFTLDGILDVSESTGLVGSTVTGSVPNDVTALEVPMGLVLSPATGTRLHGSRTARTVGDVAEVWVGRLEPETRGSATLTVLDNLQSSDPFTRIPNATDREALVTNMSSGQLGARRLWLSSHGAIGDLRGDWDAPATLLRYRHTIHTGRDVFVETATAGHLMPFGHHVAIVTIAEREFTSATNAVAAMRTRQYLTIIDDTVRSDRNGAELDGLHVPFERITASVDENDAITTTAIDDGSVIPGAFTIERAVNGANLQVHYRATDWNGDIVTFRLPATFIDADEAFGTAAGDPSARLRTWFNAAGTGRRNRRTAALRGQLLGFAPPLAGPGTTSKQTFSLELKLEAAAAGSTQNGLRNAGSPSAFPVLESATVTDAGVAGRERFTVRYHPRYLAEGNDEVANFDLAYLRLASRKVARFGADTPIRGVAAMDLTTEVFNQTSGVGLDRDAPDDPWDPSTALGAASTIIGGITLEDVLDVVDGIPIPGVDIPGLTTTVDGNTITTEFSFSPPLKENPSIGFFTTPDSRAEITVTTIVSIDGSTDPEQILEACLYDFTLSFLPGAADPIVDVHFSKACALMSTSSGLDVESNVTGITLYGVLGYMADLFGDVGFGDPRIAVDESGIELGVSLRLPNLDLGAMVVKGIRIDFGLFIPLQEDPGRLSIDVGTKKDPLTLAVMSFGGTFYAGFLVHYGPHRAEGVDIIRVGISIFWEMIKLDVIVAEITVTLRVAADFTLAGDEVVFTGRVSIEGVISLCGFVEVSLVADLSLTYRTADETLVVKGTLSWDVDTPLGGPDGKVVLGTTTIAIGNGSSARQRSSESASFGSLYSADTWAEYCGAFAEETRS